MMPCLSVELIVQQERFDGLERIVLPPVILIKVDLDRQLQIKPKECGIT
jgi:hypothetical protein